VSSLHSVPIEVDADEVTRDGVKATVQPRAFVALRRHAADVDEAKVDDPLPASKFDDKSAAIDERC
jgi:hypothetical protein